ncbi:MAG: acylphosphatase [Pseudonocardiales bacterium]
MTAEVRLTVWVTGRVQGVGYRWWARRRALQLGLRGHATNLDDGRVEIVVEGPREACQRLLGELGAPGAPGRTTAVVHLWADATGGSQGFVTK